jgi:hypothetical protein
VFDVTGRRAATPVIGHGATGPGSTHDDGRASEGRPLPDAILLVRIDGDPSRDARHLTLRR